ncbi:hypothetical protein GN956_G16036 [Arapaima gigas]
MQRVKEGTARGHVVRLPGDFPPGPCEARASAVARGSHFRGRRVPRLLRVLEVSLQELQGASTLTSENRERKEDNRCCFFSPCIFASQGEL